MNLCDYLLQWVQQPEDIIAASNHTTNPKTLPKKQQRQTSTVSRDADATDQQIWYIPWRESGMNENFKEACDKITFHCS